MKRLILLLACLYFCKANDETNNKGCNCGVTNRMTNRIINGTVTQENEYPWMVAIMWRTRHMCGGSIVTHQHVLSAAHCFYGRTHKDILIVVGHHDYGEVLQVENLYSVDAITIHEGYNSVFLLNDIALLRTSSEIEFSSTVGPVCLPNVWQSLENQIVKAMGWGYIKEGGPPSNVLLEVDLKVKPLKECNKESKGSYTIHSKQLCAFSEGKDTCQGDSGGPIVWLNPGIDRYTQVALVSFGEGCAGPKSGVNTDVAAYIQWIHKHINDSKPEEKICTVY